MKRIFSDYAYGPGPRESCWWDETIPAPDWPALRGEARADVAIVGGGFTGLSAALHLAEQGVDVALCEAGPPGWGASGRNGGFCCVGGARTPHSVMIRQFGETAARAYCQSERDAVSIVAGLIEKHGIEADTHSKGETQLAHRPRDFKALRREAELLDAQGLNPELIDARDLPAHGMNGPFHGALTLPIGFGLNPRKYLFGLAQAAETAGARLHAGTPVSAIGRAGGGFVLTADQGTLQADKVIIATNGYSSETLPHWLAGRYMPAQSTVLVTRPLTDAEIAAQGWHSDQMAYDTRGLLHYFRLMPDRRFLFGMRGGLVSSPAAEAKSRSRVRRDFETMFPAWAGVESPNSWSGFVCLSATGRPFVGAVPDAPGMFAAFAYHGNGVAMGTSCGRAVARAVLGQAPETPVLSTAPGRFPFAGARRMLMPPVYFARWLADL